MKKELHVIFGTGPVGCWTARALQDQNIAVRVVNRKGKHTDLMPVEVEVVAADASDPAQAIDAAKGATVVYQALNPPYHQWHKYFPALQKGALAAARAAGARYISIENLYMYDSSKPINENSPIRPRSKKGDLREKMSKEVMQAHRRGEIQAAALRSSDYYGPGVRTSVMGERVFRPIVKGKKAKVIGSADVAHSWAFIEDVGKAAAILGTQAEASGEAWITPHAPACTQKEMVKLACEHLGIELRISVFSPFVIRMVGMILPAVRASVEMVYQFTEPFVVNAVRLGERFGLEATPLEVGIRRTVEWYQGQ